MIYFDNSATTKPYEEVIAYIGRLSLEEFGNPSSLHSLGLRAEKILDQSRKTLADSIYANTDEIIFTSGGTEAINLALKGISDAVKRSGRHILSSPTEHAAALESLSSLEKQGFTIEMLDVDEYGRIILDDLKAKIRPDTILVNMMMVNNETGAINPVYEAASITKIANRNVSIHVDAVQAYGKLAIDLRRLKVDTMSFSAHKIHGPKGVGMLYCRKGTRLSPILSGGGQEKSIRSGTVNVPGIAGFAHAAQIKLKRMEQDNSKIIKVRDKLLTELYNHFGDKMNMNSPEDGLPGILNISFMAKSEVILQSLSMNEIYVSSGSACPSRHDTVSHVLKAMKISQKWADGAIRFSFSGDNTPEEADICAEALLKIISRYGTQ